MGYVVGFLVGVMVASLLVVLCERLGAGEARAGRGASKPVAGGNREAMLVNYVAGLLLRDDLRESERRRFETWLETTHSAQHPAPAWSRMFVLRAAEDLARRLPPEAALQPALSPKQKAA
jgi:hypothetical protein